MKVRTTLVTTVCLPNGEDDYFLVFKNRHVYLRVPGSDRDVYLWPVSAMKERVDELVAVSQRHCNLLPKEGE
jgi:hypothetical protein